MGTGIPSLGPLLPELCCEQSRHLGSWANQIKRPLCHLPLLTFTLQCLGPQPWWCPFLSTLLLLGLYQLCLLCASAKKQKICTEGAYVIAGNMKPGHLKRKLNTRCIPLYLTPPSRTPLTLILLPLSLKTQTADTWGKMFNFYKCIEVYIYTL